MPRVKLGLIERRGHGVKRLNCPASVLPLRGERFRRVLLSPALPKGSQLGSQRRLAKVPAEKLREIAAGFPLGRIGVPDDVALATLYLVSASSSWVTGVTLDISGGRIIV